MSLKLLLARSTVYLRLLLYRRKMDKEKEKTVADANKYVKESPMTEDSTRRSSQSPTPNAGPSLSKEKKRRKSKPKGSS
jgi:hypothetical protein